MSKASPTSIAALLHTIGGLLQSGRHVEGARALRRALDLAPTDTAVTAAMARLATLARTWLTFGQVQLAMDALAPLAASRHVNGSVLMLYGHALMAKGRREEAEAVFRGWLKREPHSKDAALRFAAVLADSGRSAEAEALVREVAARHGATPESAFVLGRALLGLGRFGEAEDQFRHVVQAQPDHQAAHASRWYRRIRRPLRSVPSRKPSTGQSAATCKPWVAAATPWVPCQPLSPVRLDLVRLLPASARSRRSPGRRRLAEIRRAGLSSPARPGA